MKKVHDRLAEHYILGPQSLSLNIRFYRLEFNICLRTVLGQLIAYVLPLSIYKVVAFSLCFGMS